MKITVSLQETQKNIGFHKYGRKEGNISEIYRREREGGGRERGRKYWLFVDN